MHLYCDTGYQFLEGDAGEGVHFAQNVYHANAWKITPYSVVTDNVTNTFCRAPGSTQVREQRSLFIHHNQILKT